MCTGVCVYGVQVYRTACVQYADVHALVLCTCIQMYVYIVHVVREYITELHLYTCITIICL